MIEEPASRGAHLRPIKASRRAILIQVVLTLHGDGLLFADTQKDLRVATAHSRGEKKKKF